MNWEDGADDEGSPEDDGVAIDDDEINILDLQTDSGLYVERKRGGE